MSITVHPVYPDRRDRGCRSREAGPRRSRRDQGCILEIRGAHPDQELTPEQHVAFSQAFGPVEMWDNRCTLHRGTEYDDLRWVRDMRRVTISDVAYTCEQAGIAIPASVTAS